MVKKSIGYMSQKILHVWWLDRKENITFFGGIYGLSRVKIKEKEFRVRSRKCCRQTWWFAFGLEANYPFQWLYEPKNCISRRTNWWRRSHYEKQFWEMIYAEAHKGTTLFVTIIWMKRIVTGFL
jgi:ABC-2 type transport system ATP-binding protein